jgi:hypothetical protein
VENDLKALRTAGIRGKYEMEAGGDRTIVIAFPNAIGILLRVAE